MSKPFSHIAFQVLKIAAIVLMVLLVVLAGLRLSLKTQWLQDLVRSQIIKQADKNLNASLQIGQLDGDLWNELQVANIILTQDSDTLLQARELNIQYRLLPLITGSVSIPKVDLTDARINLRQRPDGTFNVQHIISPAEAPQDTSSGMDLQFDVSQINLINTSVYLFAPMHLPDSSLAIQQLDARAGLQYGTETSFSLSSLSFQIKEGRLPQPIHIESSGNYEDQRITLQQLVVQTGQSLFKANGSAHLADSVLQAQASMRPLALSNLQPYFSELDLADEDLELTFNTSGSFTDLEVDLHATNQQFGNVSVSSRVSLSPGPAITQLDLLAKNLDLGALSNNEIQGGINQARFSANGYLSAEISEADLNWSYSVNGISFSPYELDNLKGEGTLASGQLTSHLEVYRGDETITADAEVSTPFAEQPHWVGHLDIQNMDAGYWMQDSTLQSSLNFVVKGEGNGYSPGQEPWRYAIFNNAEPGGLVPITQLEQFSPPQPDTIFVDGQPVSEFSFWGEIDADRITTEGFLTFINDQINLNGTLSNYTSQIPSYTYNLSTNNFNTNELVFLDSLNSSLNMQLSGTGQGISPEDLQLDTRFLIDSSYVNGAKVDELSFTATLADQVLTVPGGVLESSIISGTFSGRRNLVDQADPNNELALEMELKNLQPLASFTGAQILNAGGSIRGRITENSGPELSFDGELNLHDIIFNDTFTANSIEGITHIIIGPEWYEFENDFNLNSPSFYGTELQDIDLRTNGRTNTDSTSGNFNLQIKRANAGEIIQSGSFGVHLSKQLAHLRWNVFELITPDRTLSLQKPYNLSYRQNTLKTDTLSLYDGQEASLQFSIPLADSLEQKAYIAGEKFNVGTIQEIVFGEFFVEGQLSGTIETHIAPNFFEGNGSINIQNLSYKETTLDTFNLNFNVADERLLAQLSMYKNQEEITRGHLDVPFRFGDPETFEQSFFNEPIEGSLQIQPTPLQTFNSLLTEFNITQTQGILGFEGSLSGTAGEPNFEGHLRLHEPVLSGIPVDSVFADFEYHHSQKMVTGKAEIQARGQQAAAINTTLPIWMDFRTFEMHMPAEDDTVQFGLTTRDFNISVLNDFLDKQYLRDLKGQINADVNIHGPMGALDPAGSIRLANARVRVPIAGITLADIQTELSFTDAGLRLNRLSAKSGSGSFNASGNILLDGLIPNELDINARASRFRLANTSEYNLTIDMNSRLTGSPTQPVASGDLTIKNGFIYLQDFGAESIETVELEDEETSSFSPYDSLGIDMQFNIERGFFVRNSRYLDMEVELTGQLEAQKQSNQDLQLFGTLEGVQGYARPLGKNFQLDEATFTFSGPLAEPDLNIETSYIPQSSQKEGDPIVLYYIIEGTAEEPEFRFESDPTMEQQDIICYTLFNKPCYALESWQQVVSGQSGTSPTDLLVDVLLNEIESLATQQLGIDVVQIDNSSSSTGSSTSIKTGWYLNRRTFFAIVNEISGSTPETLFILEYLLTQNLDLILTQGNDNQQGIDIRWQYDY